MVRTPGARLGVYDVPATVGSHRWPQFLPDGEHFLYLNVGTPFVTHSRSRLPLINREDLDEQGKKACDAAAASSPSGRPEGVPAIRLHRSGVDVRWDSAVGRRLSELAIITTAREHDQPYDWSLHELEAQVNAVQRHLRQAK